MYKFKGNIVSWHNEEFHKVNNVNACKIVDESYLLTDEYVFDAGRVLFILGKNLDFKYLDPKTCNFHGKYIYDEKMVFIGEQYVCSTFKARFLDFNFIATNTKIYHLGREETSLVKNLGCKPKEIRAIDEKHLVDDTSYFKNINAVGQPWIKINKKVIEKYFGNKFSYNQKWDSMYWKNNDTVCLLTEDDSLIKVAKVDAKTFKYIDFRFAKDANHVFCNEKIIDIEVKSFTLNKNGFIYDAKNIYHYENLIPLDVNTFKIVDFECPFTGPFVLEDNKGIYKYEYAHGTKNELEFVGTVQK